MIRFGAVLPCESRIFGPIVAGWLEGSGFYRGIRIGRVLLYWRRT